MSLRFPVSFGKHTDAAQLPRE